MLTECTRSDICLEGRGCPTRSWRPATARPCRRRHCWWRRWTRPARCWRAARRPRRRRRKNVDPEWGDRICPEQVLALGEQSLTIVRTVPVVPCPQSPLDPLPGKLSHNPTYVRLRSTVADVPSVPARFADEVDVGRRCPAAVPTGGDLT